MLKQTPGSLLFYWQTLVVFLKSMADVHSKETRSYNMSRIKSGNTKPEMIVRRFLFKHGLRYRLHQKDLPGKPDIVLKKYKTVIFVHGCFWHSHKGCKYAVIPKTRTDWWSAKINKNVTNDESVLKRLSDIGWKVIVIWECMLKGSESDKILYTLLKKFKHNIS